ncbi:MAG: hypothetical protein ACYC9P_01795 [Rudaea sp.]
MKIIISAIASAALLFATGSAFSAVTCSSLALGTASSSSFTASGNTCTDANNQAVTTGCKTQGFNGAGESIYGITLGASYSGVSITVTPTGWDPGIYLMDVTNANSCGSQACTNTVQNTSATAATLNVPAGFVAGTYYFFVADAGVDSPGCGPYNLSFAGTLPVKLQKFSVK